MKSYASNLHNYNHNTLTGSVKGRARQLPLLQNILPFETASQIFILDQTLLFLHGLLLIWIGLASNIITTFTSYSKGR